jgi:hypothetical protein
VSDSSLLKRVVLILVVLQLASVVLLGALVLRPQADASTISVFQVTSSDIQKLDSDLQQSISESCKALLLALPGLSGGYGFGGPPTCP